MEVQQTGAAGTRLRAQLKPGTRPIREWQGRTYEIVVLDDGFSWRGTHYRSLSAIARAITGKAWSAPLFFGLKQNWPASRWSPQASDPIGKATESSGPAKLTRSASAARSTPANPSRRGWNRRSIRSE